MNSIEEATCIGGVIALINDDNSRHNDTRSAEEMAALYACDAAFEAGFEGDAETIYAHLEYLVSAGARFEFQAALELATQD